MAQWEPPTPEQEAEEGEQYNQYQDSSEIDEKMEEVGIETNSTDEEEDEEESDEEEVQVNPPPPQPPLTWVTEGLKIILTPSPLTLNSSISKYRRLPMFKSLIDLLCARYHSDFGQVSKPNICILIVYSPTI